MFDIISLALKDIKILSRDKAGLFWVLGFPVALAILFGSIFGGDAEGTASMEIALIDQDKTEQSQAFADRLGDNDAIELKLSTIDEARDRVRRGDLVAFLVIKEGFGGESAFFSSGSDTTLEIGIDPKRKAESGYLQGMISQAWFGGIQDVMSDPGSMHSQVEEALAGVIGSDMPADEQARYRSFLNELDSFVSEGGAETADGGGMQGPSIEMVEIAKEDSGPRTAFEVSFPQAIVWGLISVVSTFALAMVKERTGGTMLRLLVSPISNTQILASKGLACFLSAAGVIVTLLLLGRFAFGVRLDNPLTLTMAIVSASFCFVGLMMLLSVLGKTEQAVSGVGWAVMMMFAMVGGGMIPLIAMPKWMLAVSNYSPVKWAVMALEGAVWRGYDPGEMLLPCGTLLGIGLACYFAGVAVLSRQTR